METRTIKECRIRAQTSLLAAVLHTRDAKTCRAAPVPDPGRGAEATRREKERGDESGVKQEAWGDSGGAGGFLPWFLCYLHLGS